MTNGSPVTAEPFEPTLAAAMARLAAANLDQYARDRNLLDGPVTRLSPYITHGFLTLPEVLRTVHARRALGVRDKFVYELAWREYFRHVWHHEGEGIFESLHAGPLPDHAYARVVPADVCEARTDVPVIDTAVQLSDTGWLHNHARMWVASYVVHLRRVHWCADAVRLRAALDGAASIHGIADPHLPVALCGLTLAAPSRLFRNPERRCDSFSQFWVRVTEGVTSIDALLRDAR